MSDSASNAGVLSEYLGTTARKKQPSVRAIMVDVHLSDGKRVALPYSLLTKVSMEGGRITAEFVPGRVTIRGAKLEPLYKGLIQHRVRTVVVNSDARGFAVQKGAEGAREQARGSDPDDALITGIMIEEPQD